MGEKGSDGAERRSAPRIPRKSRVVHRTMEFPEPPGRTGRLRDLSPTGVRFESDREYPSREMLKLELTLPGWERERIDFFKGDPREDLKPLTALAEVRWVKPLGAGLFEVGAVFVNIDEWHGKALLQYLEKLEEQAAKRAAGGKPPGRDPRGSAEPGGGPPPW